MKTVVLKNNKQNGKRSVAPIENARWSGAFFIRLAVAVFCVELVGLSLDGISGGLTPSEIVCAVLISAFICGTLGAGLAASAGLLVAYAAGSRSVSGEVSRLISLTVGYLKTSKPKSRRRFIAIFVAIVLGVLFYALLAIPPIIEFVATIQTPLYAAVLSVATSLAALLVAGFLWPVWYRTGNLFSSIISRPIAPWALLTTVVGVSSLFLILAVIITWTDFACYLPWRPLVVSTSSLGTVAILTILKQHFKLPEILRRGLYLLGILLFTSGVLTSLFLPSSLRRAGYLNEDASGPLGWSHAIFVRVFDFDGDNYLSILGQGDCDAFNADFHPGAVDQPGDGADHDCNGNDGLLVHDVAPGFHDYQSRPRPHAMPVILVTIDAVSALRMDLHGAQRKTMPKLTERAQNGVVFNWAFSEGPATRLSFPSIMTGLHNSQIKRKLSKRTVVPWVEIDQTLATVFSNAGYATESVAPDKYFGKTLKWLHKGFGRVDVSLADERAGQEKNGASVTSVALERLDAIKKNDNFLLWVHYTDAHYPHRLPAHVKPTFGKSEADIYDRELLMLDDFLDDLFKGIATRMKGREHIIALTADHGQAFDAAHEKWHQDYDVSTAVSWIPLIFWSPFGKEHRSDQLAQNIDLMPTLLNMVGIRATGLAGESLLRAIQGQPDNGRPIMQQFYLPELRAQGKDPLKRLAVRHGKYVLHQLRSRDEIRLYDYQTDPLETKDLKADLPEVVRELKGYRDGILSWAYPEWNRPKK